MHWVLRLIELLEDWRDMLRQAGWRAALPLVIQEIARLPYSHCEFQVLTRSLAEPLPDLHPKIALEIRPFESTDVELVEQINRPSEARQCAKRLELGHQGLVALSHGQPAGYAWGCFECNPAMERASIRLRPGDVLCVDAYTAPAFRGQGVQTALVLGRLRLFRDQGCQRAVVFIEISNGPSLAAWHKVGSCEVDRIDFLRIGSWRWTRYD